MSKEDDLLKTFKNDAEFLNLIIAQKGRELEAECEKPKISEEYIINALYDQHIAKKKSQNKDNAGGSKKYKKRKLNKQKTKKTKSRKNILRKTKSRKRR